MRKSRELPKVEIAFNALSVPPMLTRSASTSGDYVSSKQTKVDEDKKIEKGLALLMKREPKGKTIFKCWTFNEYGHYSSKFPKRAKKFKKPNKSRMPMDCLFANEKKVNVGVEELLSEHDDENDELGLVIKEEIPKKE